MMNANVNLIDNRIFKFMTKLLLNQRNEIINVSRSQANVYFEQEQLVFSIKGLYDYLDFDDQITLRQFKKALYAGQLNAKLATYNAKIAVYGNSLSENRSENKHLYCLHLPDLVLE